MDPHMTEEDRDIYELGPHRRLRQELRPPCPQHTKKKKLVNFKVSLRRRSVKEQPRRSSTGSITLNPRPEGRKNSVTFLEDEIETLQTSKDTRKGIKTLNNDRKDGRGVVLELQETKTTKEKREAFRNLGGERKVSAHRSIEKSGLVIANKSFSRDQDQKKDLEDSNTNFQRDEELSKATQYGLKLETTHRRSIQNESAYNSPTDIVPSQTPPLRTIPDESLPYEPPVHPNSAAQRRKNEFSRSASSMSTDSWRKIKTIASPPRPRMNSLVEMLITRRKTSLAPSIWTPSVPRSMPAPRPANFQDQEEPGQGSYIVSFIQLDSNPPKQRSQHRLRRLPNLAGSQRELMGQHYLDWLSKIVANPLLLSGVLLKGLEIGVQFPVLHLREIPQGGQGGGEHRRLEASIGPDSILLQGEYEEVVAWIPELLVTCPSDPSQWARCYIVLGFMTLDGDLNQNMEKSWKEWTGALFIYCNIDDDLGLKKLSFLRRRSPHQPKLFSYLVIVEIDTVTRKNSLSLLDFVYRMRLRCMSGYISVYQSHSPDSDMLLRATTVPAYAPAVSATSATSSTSSSSSSSSSSFAQSERMLAGSPRPVLPAGEIGARFNTA